MSICHLADIVNDDEKYVEKLVNFLIRDKTNPPWLCFASMGRCQGITLAFGSFCKKFEEPSAEEYEDWFDNKKSTIKKWTNEFKDITIDDLP